MPDVPQWVILYGVATLFGVGALLWSIARDARPRTVIYRRAGAGALVRTVVAGVAPDEHRATHAPGPMTSREWLGSLDEDWIEWHGDIGYGCSRARLTGWWRN